MVSLHDCRREILYQPFLTTKIDNSFRSIDIRDTLLALATKHDYANAKKLATDHPCLDGSTFTILVAKKINGKYYFDSCNLPAFAFFLNAKSE